jgi:peptide/nickel transport system ATP-binding protein
MALLEVNSLSMRYEIEGKGWVKAVDDVSISLEEGQSLAIAGESGCGKTSLANSIIKLLPQNGKYFGGKILLDGKNILDLPDEEFRKQVRWKKISLVPQGAMNALNPVIKVGDQIAEAIMLHDDLTETEAKKKIEEVFRVVGIDPSRSENYTHEFSGGMRQRAMIAMALVCEPKIVIADEPTTALDVIVQAQVFKLLKNLQKKFNIALILISHDVSMIAELCDKVAIMYAGRIAEYGSAVDVYLDPQHPYTRGLLAAVPKIGGKRSRLKSIEGVPPDLLVPPEGCRFWPRCPYAFEKCKKEELFPNSRVELDNGRVVFCHWVKKKWKR